MHSQADPTAILNVKKGIAGLLQTGFIQEHFEDQVDVNGPIGTHKVTRDSSDRKTLVVSRQLRAPRTIGSIRQSSTHIGSMFHGRGIDKPKQTAGKATYTFAPGKRGHQLQSVVHKNNYLISPTSATMEDVVARRTDGEVFHFDSSESLQLDHSVESSRPHRYYGTNHHLNPNSSAVISTYLTLILTYYGTETGLTGTMELILSSCKHFPETRRSKS